MTAGGVSGRSRLVLVVDDDGPTCGVLRAVLEADDFEVEVARDGQTALDLAAVSPPMVAVLDVMMPGMDGVEVCRRIDHSKTKVVILTGKDQPGLESEVTAAGANVFMTKPFSAAELLDVVAGMAVQ